MTFKSVMTLVGSCLFIVAAGATLHSFRSVAQSEQQVLLREYLYPNATLLKDLLNNTRFHNVPEPSYCCIYTSSDDFSTVCKWYKEKCKFSIKEVFHSHVARHSAASLLEDSTECKGCRPVSVLALCDYNGFQSRLVMVVISRGDKETLTHIMLSISQLPDNI